MCPGKEKLQFFKWQHCLPGGRGKSNSQQQFFWSFKRIEWTVVTQWAAALKATRDGLARLVNRESSREGEPGAWGVTRPTSLKSQVWWVGGHMTWNKCNVLDVKVTSCWNEANRHLGRGHVFYSWKHTLNGQVQFLNYPIERGPMTGKTSVADYTCIPVLICRRMLLIS